MSGLVATRVLGLCTIQDLGRPGRMHEALAPGGALVPELLVAANRAVGNPDGAAAIEIQGRLVVRAETALALATDRDGHRMLAAGEELAIASEPRRVSYLAVRGGVAAPVVLGSRATQLSAGIGRVLRTNERLLVEDSSAAIAVADVEVVDFELPDREPVAICIVPGPDREAFADDALVRLLTSTYRIAPTSDRVGTRLQGPAIVRRRADRAPPDTSKPMVVGAIEVPGDGVPIVLGPEHPTTGGYPVIAVVASRDRGRFFAIRLGGAVTFTLP